jgi:hypothetical protein
MDAGTTTPKTETSSMAALHRREPPRPIAREQFVCRTPLIMVPQLAMLAAIRRASSCVSME